jgi:hypothetical protein
LPIWDRCTCCSSDGTRKPIFGTSKQVRFSTWFWNSWPRFLSFFLFFFPVLVCHFHFSHFNLRIVFPCFHFWRFDGVC